MSFFADRGSIAAPNHKRKSRSEHKVKVGDDNRSRKRQFAHEQWLQDLSFFAQRRQQLGYRWCFAYVSGCFVLSLWQTILDASAGGRCEEVCACEDPITAPANKWTKLTPALMCVILGIFLKVLHPLWYCILELAMRYQIRLYRHGRNAMGRVLLYIYIYIYVFVYA